MSSSTKDNVIYLGECGICRLFIPSYEDDGCCICHPCMNNILEIYMEANGQDAESPSIPALFQIGKAINGGDVHV